VNKVSNTISTVDSTITAQEEDDDDDDCIKMEDNVEDIMSYITNGSTVFTNSEERSVFISNLINTMKLVAGSIIKNMKEGEVGQRGEKYVLGSVLLSSLILLGTVPILSWLLKWLVKLAALILFFVGLGMMANALWELKGNVSVWAWASKDNVMVFRGVFQVVRHPLYGGLLLVCGSLAMLQGNVDKIVLTFALAVLLVRNIEC